MNVRKTAGSTGGLIVKACNAHLAPAGFFKSRHSRRVWIKDKGFWLVLIEFQPSPGSNSYLNVGASFLWGGHAHLGFDVFERVRDFRPIIAEKQTTVDDAVILALKEAGRIERKFSDLRSIAEVLSARLSSRRFGWPAYHAAISNGLVGNLSAAHDLFGNVVAEARAFQPGSDLQNRAEMLSVLVQDQDRFNDAIEAIIVDRRTRLALPTIDLSRPTRWNRVPG